MCDLDAVLFLFLLVCYLWIWCMSSHADSLIDAGVVKPHGCFMLGGMWRGVAWRGVAEWGVTSCAALSCAVL